MGLVLGLLTWACSVPATQDVDEATRAESDVTWFRELDLGLEPHSAVLDGRYPMPENLGPGVGIFDYDGDGDLDLYVIDGGDTSAPTPNRLLRQESDGSFVDVSDAAGVGDSGYGMGVAVADIEGDGDLDLFATNYGADRLYVNNGDGAFSPTPIPMPSEDDVWSSSATFCDIDLDDLPELFVVTYVDYDSARNCTDRAGRQEYCGPSAFAAIPDLLLKNLGGGSFQDVSARAGISAVASRGLGVVCHDLDGDRLPDIFVANDGEKNDLWINRGDGRFEERALPMGAAMNVLGRPESSMGVAVGDLDGDLDIDLLLTHLDRETNTLYRNLGSLGFEDATAEFDLGPSTLSLTGFGAVFFDPDSDGDLDLLLANGKVRRGATPATEAIITAAARAEVPALLREYAEPNLFLENVDGHFEDSCSKVGDLCSRVEVGRGLVFGDIDRNGAPDVVLANCAGPTRVFLSTIQKSGHWLNVRALRPSGSDVTGATIRVTTSDGQLLRPIISSYSYQSAGDPAAHFGLGSEQFVESLAVDWPNGTTVELKDLPADRFIIIYQADSSS